MTKKSQEYNNIEQLSSIEHIRLRPGMYIGSNETPSHLFSEVIDNALDEAANGFCDRIDITYKDNIVSIKDNGRGIPHTKTNKGQEAIIAATENMSGGKFNRDNYKKSCGLHGVGLCAVRALSDFLTISSVRDKEEYKAEFVDAELKDFIKTKVNEKPGTFVQFKPDIKYFEHEEIPLDYIIERGKVAVTELPKLKIFFNDTEITPYTDEEIIGKSDIKFPIIKASDKQTNEITIRLGYTSVGLQSNESGCVNLLPVNSGTHIDIAKKAIVDAWEQTGFIGDLELKPEDVLIGLQMWVSASFIETAWTSQDKKQLKMRLKNFEELIKSLSKVIVKTIQSLTKENRDTLLRKFVDYRESQNKLSTAKYMQGIVKYGDEGKTTKRSFSSDSKLVDCVSEDRDSTELFVCEGTSAGSNLISQRDPMIHAVLPLRGKPRNIMEESVETILNNLEMRSLVNALGTGLMKHERPELCRYGKIIIASDADCFTGDTKVYTCDGLEHTLEEACTNDLDLWVLSRDQNNKIVPAKAKSLKSRLVTELCLITLDNGESIKCTPDHRFMLKNGEYKCACELTANDSLMPLYTKRRGLTNYVKNDDWVKLHNLVSQKFPYIYPNTDFSKTIDVHHIDRNHDNNNPDNLLILNHGKHGSLHLTEYNKSIKHKETNSIVAKRTDILERNRRHIISYNKSQKHRERAKEYSNKPEIVLRNKKLMISYNKSQKHRDTVREMNQNKEIKELQMKGRILKSVNRLLSFLSNTEHLSSENYDLLRYKYIRGARGVSLKKCLLYFSTFDELLEQAKTYNHFVIKSEIIRLNEPVQMYDLIVPEYNNFALSAGVFVHNCDGLQISSLVLAALCYLVPNTVLSGKVHLMTAPLYGIINQNIIKFETDDLDRYYLIDDTAVVNNKEKSVKSIKVGDIITLDNKNYTVKSVTRYSKDEFIPVWECYLSPTIKLKRYKGLGSMSPAEAKISLLSDKRKLQTITGTQIDKVMKLVGETEFKKLLMKQQDIIDWQC